MGLVLMATAAWTLFLLVVSACATLGFPVVRTGVGRLHPGPRAQVLRLVATAPVVFATMGVLLCFAPKVFDNALARTDHCAQHADFHPHFCLNHPPQVTYGAELWPVGAGIGVLLVAVVSIRASRFRRSARTLGQLVSTARFDGERGVWLIEADLPVAMTVGVMRPRTLLSAGLLQDVPGRLVDAIVAHERAHERRRDGLWKLATELFSFGHLPGTRRAVLDDLGLACEQACDEDAGTVLGDRTRVAEALVAIERLRHTASGFGPAALAFGAQGLTTRVESLIGRAPRRDRDRRVVLALLAALVVAAVLAADPLHHFTETLIHVVMG